MLPESEIIGCKFHLYHGWFRKIQNLDLSKKYSCKKILIILFRIRISDFDNEWKWKFFSLVLLKIHTLNHIEINTLNSFVKQIDIEKNAFYKFKHFVIEAIVLVDLML